MGQLTTHVLDIANGVPAGGMEGRLMDAGGEIRAAFRTNANGRCDHPLLEGATFRPGTYTLVFYTAAYFRARGTQLSDPPFLDEISIPFGVADASAHYHVPLLVSPWSFSTYRGS